MSLDKAFIDSGKERNALSRDAVPILDHDRQSRQHEKMAFSNVDSLSSIGNPIAFLDIDMTSCHHGLNLLGLLSGMHIIHQCCPFSRRDKEDIQTVGFQGQRFLDEMDMSDEMDFVLNVFGKHPVSVDDCRNGRRPRGCLE